MDRGFFTAEMFWVFSIVIDIMVSKRNETVFNISKIYLSMVFVFLEKGICFMDYPIAKSRGRDLEIRFAEFIAKW